MKKNLFFLIPVAILLSCSNTINKESTIISKKNGNIILSYKGIENFLKTD